jgi:signal peptidase II
MGHTATERTAVLPLWRWMTLSFIAVAVLSVDQALKESVRSTFEPGEGTHLVGPYFIQHIQNAGVAGGGFQGNALPLAALALLAILALYGFLARRDQAALPLVIGFGLLIGGGLGNLVDRARLGLVTDVIRTGPNAFNIADMAIFVGGLIVLVAILSSYVRYRLGRRDQPTSSGG